MTSTDSIHNVTYEGMHIVDGALIVPAPAYATDAAFTNLKRALLHMVHTKHIRRVIIDVSRIHFLDSIIFSTLSESARMTELLGAKTVFVGFQPGVVSALIDMDIPCDDLLCAACLEDGLALHRSLQSANVTEEDTEDNVDETEEPEEVVEEGQQDDNETIDNTDNE